MNISSVASVSAIVADVGNAQRLFSNALGVSFEGDQGDYVFTEQLPGVKHFGLWPLREAAKACFGTDEWPQGMGVPQASVEFELDSVEEVRAAAKELIERDFRLLHDVKKEPWGQTITRLLNDEGLLIGVCHTPWFH